MSFPANPLSEYRSYAYYHVLVMCDCTETAEALSTNTIEDPWRHPTAADVSDAALYSMYGKYAPRDIALTRGTSASSNFMTGKYCVLIDGSSDADVAITNLQFTAATAAAATDMDNNTSTAIEGSIAFSEPRGISFMHTLVEACRALNTDAAQVVYVVKTFFVGHAFTNSTTDAPQIISNIEPLKFIAYDVRGSYSRNGGEYFMEFACAQHGISRLPQYSKSADSFSIQSESTLGATFTKLGLHLKARYEDMYNCVDGLVRTMDETSGTDVANRLSKVEYELTWDPEFDNYIVSNKRQQQKDELDCTSPANIACPAGTSIEDAIHLIMLASSDVSGSLAEPATPGTPKYGYKIDSSYNSTIESGADGARYVKYVVKYHVRRFLEPRSFDFMKVLSNTTDINDADKQILDRNLITFDYIYTGKNLDIMDMDIKMNMGIAYLQIASMSTSTKEQPVDASRVTGLAGGSQSLAAKFAKDSQIPVFFSTDVRSPLFKNIQNSNVGMQAAYTMAKHSSFEVMDTSMTIYGNPLLLNSVNVSTSNSSANQTRTQSAHFADFSRVPSFAKINIKMPRLNDDIALLKQSSSGTESERDYAKDFWFQGYYYVYGIQNVFEGGQFTQRLQMIGIPEQGLLDLTQTTQATTGDLSQRVDACYDTITKVRPTTPEPKLPSKAPEVPVDHPPLNVADTKSLLDDRKLTVDDVTQYTTKATPELKAAMNAAALTHGIDPVVLARVAYHESRYDLTAKAKTSSATGPFQFIDKTWMEQVTKGNTGLPKNTPRDEALSKRTDPVAASNAAAAYIKSNQDVLRKAGVVEYYTTTNTYLAHFAGPYGAKAALLAIQNGEGNLPLAEAYRKYGVSNAEVVAARQLSQNRLSTDTTAAGLQAFAAKAMANTVKDPLKTAKDPKPATQQTTVSSVDQTIAVGYKRSTTGADQLSKTLAPTTKTDPVKDCSKTTR